MRRLSLARGRPSALLVENDDCPKTLSTQAAEVLANEARIEGL